MNQKVRECRTALIQQPIDIASLAAFRVLFGLLMASAVVRFVAKGWVQQLYLEPAFHFPCPGFDWVRPWPGAWMYAHFAAMGALALGVAIGLYYRICITLFFLAFTYVELIDQTAYLNHYYLISLLSGLMIFLPAHRAWSLDVWRKPELRVDLVPACSLNLLRFQIAVVYVFAGLAKVNADWLFHAEPLRIWLAARSDMPVIGHFLDRTWVACVASWWGAIYDLSVPFLLMARRTRLWAFMAVIAFHVATWLLFNIGMFPWVMIVTASVFFRPDWPRTALRKLTVDGSRFLGPNRESAPSPPGGAKVVLELGRPHIVLALLLVYAAGQIILPLRPYWLNQDPPAWTYRGFNLAWQVMVAEKSGYVEFFVRNKATAEVTRVDPRSFITRRQEVLMAQDPYLIRQLAQKMALESSHGVDATEVFVNAFASLNGRPSQLIIDPNIDLAKAQGTGWILPLNKTNGKNLPGIVQQFSLLDSQ